MNYSLDWQEFFLIHFFQASIFTHSRSYLLGTQDGLEIRRFSTISQNFLPEFVEYKQEKDVFSCRKIKTKLKITQPRRSLQKRSFVYNLKQKIIFEKFIENFINFKFVPRFKQV